MLRVDFFLQLDYFFLTRVLVESANDGPEMDVTHIVIAIFVKERENFSDFSNLKLG